MAKFNLCTIRPKGFLHSSAFQEVKDSLAWALTALGHQAMLTENAFSAGESQNILFGAELLSPQSQIPANSILYNFEQPSHPNLQQVRKLAQHHTVWEYSKSGVSLWGPGIQVHHVPVGYTPNLTRIPKVAQQNIDISFLGWMTPRRRKIVHDLKEAGLNVYASDCCYGGSRDQIISRSKVCLNVHHDGRDMLEIVRISYLLANSKCVVSEIASDLEDYAQELEGAMEWWPYDSLVKRCSELVRDCQSPAREKLERNGIAAFSRMDYVATVEAALDSHAISFEQDRPTHSILCARYERGLKEGDMIDFLPWIREYAQGDILEIGTRDGASTSAFLLGLEEHGGHLTSIDIEDCSQLWSHPQWTFHTSNSLAVKFADNSFDIALIDGSHERAAFIGDLYNCYHWVRPGGMILAHDIRPERGHEYYAIGLREEFFKFLKDHPDVTWEELPGRYGMGVMRKPK